MKSSKDSIKQVIAMFDKEDLKYIKSKKYIGYLNEQKKVDEKVKKLVIKR